MRVDNIDFFSSEKLQRIIAERFGQSVDLADLNDDSLKIFEQSTREAVKNFERSMGFNSNTQIQNMWRTRFCWITSPKNRKNA